MKLLEIPVHRKSKWINGMLLVRQAYHLKTLMPPLRKWIPYAAIWYERRIVKYDVPFGK